MNRTRDGAFRPPRRRAIAALAVLAVVSVFSALTQRPANAPDAAASVSIRNRISYNGGV